MTFLVHAWTSQRMTLEGRVDFHYRPVPEILLSCPDPVTEFRKTNTDKKDEDNRTTSIMLEINKITRSNNINVEACQRQACWVFVASSQLDLGQKTTWIGLEKT